MDGAESICGETSALSVSIVLGLELVLELHSWGGVDLADRC